LLRGINVGGQRPVKMDDLRQLFADLGFAGVSTYVQSGNVVFTSPRSDATRLRTSIEQGILAELGLDVTVLLRSGDDLELVLRGNPFLARTDDLSALHVTFLGESPTAERVAQLPGGDGTEDFSVAGSEVYLFCPNGYGRSKLTNSVFERRLDTRATTRNWKTVMKLADMTS
jgi:uncharacterized protein (DUF1697 family)